MFQLIMKNAMPQSHEINISVKNTSTLTFYPSSPISLLYLNSPLHETCQLSVHSTLKNISVHNKYKI